MRPSRESLFPPPFSWLQWTIHPSDSEPKDLPYSDKTDDFPASSFKELHQQNMTLCFFSFLKQNVFSHGLVSYQCQMTPDASTGPPVGAHGWEQRGDGPALSAPASQASLLEYSANFLANNKLITIFQRISEHLQFSI